jgi:hypothetical protein
MNTAKGLLLSVLFAVLGNGCVVREHTRSPPREEVRVKEVHVEDHDHHDHHHDHDHDDHDHH